MSAPERHTRRSGDSERGAFLILWALLVVGVLIMVAIVIDLGQLRSDRRTEQTVADFGALAAGFHLAGVSSGGALATSSEEACQDAFEYIRLNTPGFPASAHMNDPSTGCPGLPTVASCTPATTPKDAVAANASPYEVFIRYPVSDADIAPARSGDGTQCERMRVTVRKTTDTFFGGILGVSEQTASASAVIRGFAASLNQPTPALLLLDRTSCEVLVTNGANSGLWAQAFDRQAGFIHLDSDASNSNCGGNNPNINNSSGWVVHGLRLTSSHPRAGDPGIRADDSTLVVPPATTPAEARLSMVAWRTRPTNAAAKTAENTNNTVGVRPSPSLATVIGRAPADRRYNAVIRQLKTDTDNLATTLAAVPATDPLPGGYVRLSAIPLGCTMNGVISAPKVYVDCPMTVPNGGIMVFLSSHVVTSTPINISNGGTLVLTDPLQVVVTNPDNTNPGILNSQSLFINTGRPSGATNPADYVPAGTFLCANRGGATQANPTPTSPISTRLVVRAGGFFHQSSSALSRMCHTTLYLSNVASPTNSPGPQNNNNLALLDVGNGSVDWTAPNIRWNPACMIVTAPGCYQLTDSVTYSGSGWTETFDMSFEDLAFWTEASGTGGPGVNNSLTSGAKNSIGGAGSVNATGVFVSPNAHVQYGGQAVSNVGADAQFIARSLYLAGQANMILRPNPNNAVAVPDPIFGLIR